MDDTNEMLSQAIVKMREKTKPGGGAPAAMISEEPYRKIFDLLEVWDKNEQNDEDIKNKAQYIYEFLSKKSANVRDGLVSLLTNLAVPTPREPRIETVYRYLRLKNEANKTMEQLYVIGKSMASYHNPEKTDGAEIGNP